MKNSTNNLNLRYLNYQRESLLSFLVILSLEWVKSVTTQNFDIQQESTWCAQLEKVEFAANNKMSIMNILFQHHSKKFYRDEGEARLQTYILCPELTSILTIKWLQVTYDYQCRIVDSKSRTDGRKLKTRSFFVLLSRPILERKASDDSLQWLPVKNQSRMQQVKSNPKGSEISGNTD